ncbi:ribonuclease J [soil metagenome]
MTAVNTAPARIIFLGGLGEIGRNMTVVELGGRLLVIDAGLSFPSDEMFGVDLVIPDFSYVRDRAESCDGIVLTHGHEDHVGALSWLLKEVDVPVYGTPLTLGMTRKRLDSAGLKADLIPIEAPGKLTIGPFRCETLAVSHSIPDAISLVIDTDQGRILYTSDFKLDQIPEAGRRAGIEAFKGVAALGVDLMLSDSTNADRAGRTPSEAVVNEALAEIFAGARRKIIVACFASHLHRIQQVCERAEASGRRVAFVGRSMVANVEVGLELGCLSFSPGTIVDVAELGRHDPAEAVIVCTGSQGEPLSALSLIASGEHKTVSVEPDDVVILSASPIPGNESAVHRVLNALYRTGAEVFHSGNSSVHVSGHASSDELAELASVVRPRNFVPMHGEYRHLVLHSRIAEDSGIPKGNISIVEDGDVLELSGGRIRRGQQVRAGMVLIDGLGVGDVGPIVLRDRKTLAEDGILICVVTIDSQHGEILAGPDLISRGFTYHGESRELLEEAAGRVAEALQELSAQGVTEWSTIKKACRHALGEFVWKRTRRRPMILPIIMEI